MEHKEMSLLVLGFDPIMLCADCMNCNANGGSCVGGQCVPPFEYVPMRYGQAY